MMDEELIEQVSNEVDIQDEDFVGAVWKALEEVRPRPANQPEVWAEIVRRSANSVSTANLARSFSYSADQFWLRASLFDAVADALPLTAEEVLSIDETIPAEEYGRGTIGHYLHGVRRWASSFPANALKLIDRVTAAGNVPHITTPAIEGVADAVKAGSAPAEQLSVVLSSLRLSDVMRHLYIRALPVLVDDGLKTNADAAQEIKTAASSADEPTAATAVQTAGFMIMRNIHDNTLLEVIRLAADDTRLTVRASSLFAAARLADSSIDSEVDTAIIVAGKCVELTEVGCEALIQQLGWLLFSVAQRAPMRVLNVLRLWTLIPEHVTPVWYSNRFLHVINQLPIDPLMAGAIEWIVADRRLAPVALHILTAERAVTELPQSMIRKLDEREAWILLLFLAAHDHDPAVARLLESLAAGLLRRADRQRFVSEVQDALTHLILNFVPDSQGVLGRLKSLRSPTARAIYLDLRKLRDSVVKALDAAASLREFIPSLRRQDAYLRFEREFQQRIRSTNVDDPGRFVFSSLFKQSEVYLLGGSSVLQRVGDEHRSTPLGHIEVTLAFPRVTAADPDAAFVRRVTLLGRAEKLRSRNEEPQ